LPDARRARRPADHVNLALAGTQAHGGDVQGIIHRSPVRQQRTPAAVAEDRNKQVGVQHLREGRDRSVLPEADHDLETDAGEAESSIAPAYRENTRHPSGVGCGSAAGPAALFRRGTA